MHAIAVRSVPPAVKIAVLVRTWPSEHGWAAVASGILLLATCVAAHAVSSAQEELAEVKRSVPNLDKGADYFDSCGACHGPDGGGTALDLVSETAGQQHPGDMGLDQTNRPYRMRIGSWEKQCVQVIRQGAHHTDPFIAETALASTH